MNPTMPRNSKHDLAKTVRRGVVCLAIMGCAGVSVVPLVRHVGSGLAVLEKAESLLAARNIGWVTGVRSELAGSSGLVPDLTPWQSVGGCGAGGSGGGGGGAKWVGKGITGGLIDVQLMGSYTFGQNFSNNSISPRFSMKPRYDTQIGLSIPLTSKIGEVQPTTLWEPKYYMTGGLGDIGLDVSQAFGMEGEYSISLALALPTGQYDIKRGDDRTSTILPTSLQKGTGLYSASLDLGYSKDVGKNGMWLLDVTYSNPFNVSFSGKNEFNDKYFKAYAAAFPNDKRFFYHLKSYGENDLGDYVPPSVTLSAYCGYKGFEHYVHSFGVTFNSPIAIAWIHDEHYLGSSKSAVYDPRPDPDHKAWNATLNYGIEASRSEYPLFFAVSLPIHDKGDPRGKWDPPDTKDFMNQWTFSIGVKSTMF